MILWAKKGAGQIRARVPAYVFGIKGSTPSLLTTTWYRWRDNRT